MTDQPNAGASGRTPETGAIRNVLERVPHGSALFCERCVAREQLTALLATVERQQAEIERLTAETERLRAAYEGSGAGLFLKFERGLGGACQVCGGVGQLPDERVTSGRLPCPRCLGTGYVAVGSTPTERPTDG